MSFEKTNYLNCNYWLSLKAKIIFHVIKQSMFKYSQYTVIDKKMKYILNLSSLLNELIKQIVYDIFVYIFINFILY